MEKRLSIELGDLRVLFDREVAANKKLISSLHADYIIKGISKELDLDTSLPIVQTSIEKLKFDVVEKFEIGENNKLISNNDLHPVWKNQTYMDASKLFKKELSDIKKQLSGTTTKNKKVDLDYNSLEGKAGELYRRIKKR